MIFSKEKRPFLKERAFFAYLILFFFQKLLCSEHDRVFTAFIGKTTLEIRRVGSAQGTIRGKLDRSALREGASRHDDLIRIAGHGRGLGRYEGIHRGACLNTAAERAKTLGIAKLHRLNDIVAHSIVCGLHVVAKLTENVRSESGRRALKKPL